MLAAAIKAKATTILTLNLKDFPAASLSIHGVVAVHPDAFVVAILKSDPGAVERALAAHQQSLKNPPVSVAELLTLLEKQGMKEPVRLLRERAARTSA